MPALSEFQTLPLHIAESIAQHLVITDRFASVLVGPATAEQWMVLYNVSFYWRELALGHFCKEVTLSPAVQSSKRHVVTFANWPSSLGISSNKYYRYAKHVTFSFREPQSPLFNVFANFADAWPDYVLFSNATEITVRVDKKTTSGHYLFDSFADTDKEALQRMTDKILKASPKLSKVNAMMFGPATTGTQSVSRSIFEKNGLQKLLMSLSTGTKTENTDIGATAFIQEYPHLMNEASLTSLHYACPANDESALNIIIRNAPVLVSLVLESTLLSHVKRIVQDSSTRNQIVYPRLKRLEFLAKWYFELGNGQKVEAGIPFPSLESIKCEIRYIFEDDTMFRGCSATLKHLKMQINYETAKMLLEHGVPERLQNLRNICITSGYQSLPSHDGESYFLRFAFGVVSPSTRSFSLLKFRGSYSIVETIASYPAMQNILYLDISDVKLQLTEVIELIQILPNLEYLCYSCGGLGSSLGRVLYKEMPHILHAKYYPLSMRLKCCGINTFKRTPTRSIAVTAMVLAILCPRLTFAKVPSYLITTYNSAIENAIRDEPYLEHSDRLESLLN